MNPTANLTLEGMNDILRKRARDDAAPFETLVADVVDGKLLDPIEAMHGSKRQGGNVNDFTIRCEAIVASRPRQRAPARSRRANDPTLPSAGGENCCGRSDSRRRGCESAMDLRVQPTHLHNAMNRVILQRLVTLATRIADGEKVSPAEQKAALKHSGETRTNSPTRFDASNRNARSPRRERRISTKGTTDEYDREPCIFRPHASTAADNRRREEAGAPYDSRGLHHFEPRRTTKTHLTTPSKHSPPPYSMAKRGPPTKPIGPRLG